MAVLLYVIDEGVYLVTRQGTRQYVPFEEGDRLEALFARLPPFTRIRLIFDLYEEDVNFSEVPKAYPWERGKLLTLQLKKHGGANILLTGGDWLVRRQEKKDQVRIRRLIAEEHVKLVFERLQKHRLVLEGIYSATFLFESIVRSLNLSRAVKKALSTQPMLITVRRDASSYRQLFFLKGKMVFTRTLQLPELVEGDREILNYLARETDMTIKYLYSNKRLIPMQTPISLLFIDSPKFSMKLHDIREFMRENLVEAQRWNSDSFVLEAVFADRFCAGRKKQAEFLQDIVLCHFKKRKLPPSHFSHPWQQAAQRIWQGRQVAVALTLVALGVSGWVLGQQGSEKWFLEEKIEFMEQKIRQTTALKHSLEARLNTEYDARDLRAIVNFSEQFRHHAARHSIVPLLEQIGHFLTDYPDVELQRLNITRVNKDVLSEGLWVDAQMSIRKPAVLYEQIMQYLQRLITALNEQPGFSQIKLTQKPIRTELDKQQQVDRGLVLPQESHFAVRFFWQGGDHHE